MSPSLRKFGAAFAGALAALIAAVAVAAPSAGADNVPSPGLFKHFKTVTVTRDSAGIAHIVARNFVALGYGEGYAFAQDNLCTFANDVVTLEGERSRYFGPNGLAVNYSAPLCQRPARRSPSRNQ